jgi:hypothetical protein
MLFRFFIQSNQSLPFHVSLSNIDGDPQVHWETEGELHTHSSGGGKDDSNTEIIQYLAKIRGVL